LIKIKDHWYPEQPTKGQGYRSLSLDKRAHSDPLLQKAAVTAGLSDPFVSYFKDTESIIMWIDPDAVVVRLCYTPYIPIPPDEKVLYRSVLPTVKTVSTPPRNSYNRSNFAYRTPPSPPQTPFRPFSNSPPYVPLSYHSPQSKNHYVGHPTPNGYRNGMNYTNTTKVNPSQYFWHNGHQSVPDENKTFALQNPNITKLQQHQSQLYTDYYTESPLETQA